MTPTTRSYESSLGSVIRSVTRFPFVWMRSIDPSEVGKMEVAERALWDGVFVRESFGLYLPSAPSSGGHTIELLSDNSYNPPKRLG
jgi:hypothetical protein